MREPLYSAQWVGDIWYKFAVPFALTTLSGWAYLYLPLCSYTPSGWHILYPWFLLPHCSSLFLSILFRLAGETGTGLGVNSISESRSLPPHLTLLQVSILEGLVQEPILGLADQHSAFLWLLVGVPVWACVLNWLNHMDRREVRREDCLVLSLAWNFSVIKAIQE